MRPHMVIVDISLKDRSGLELVRELKERDIDLPILVISMHDEGVYAERALRAGARGYIMKEEMTGKVVQAIRQVLQGKIYASESMVETMLGKIIFKPSAPENPVDALSNRELEVFGLIGKGYGRKEIAGVLNVGVKTVGAYKEHIKKKLDLKNASELIKHAIEWVKDQSDTNLTPKTDMHPARDSQSPEKAAPK